MVSTLAERQHVFSLDEYFEIAERSQGRIEFWEGAILDMSGGSPRHSAICSNIGRILGAQLRGKPCRPFDSNLKIRSIATNRATYADATVVCGPLELDPADRTRQTVLNPTVVVEVLSPSTEADDRGAKLCSYQAIPSMKAVVLVGQQAPEVVIHARRADGSWTQFSHTSGEPVVPGIDCSLPLAEVYEDLPDA